MNSSHRIHVEVHASALRNNFRVIRAKCPGKKIIPMIKANAYGHGAQWVAGELRELPQVYGFGVATLEEGKDLRARIGARTRILVFSGAVPWSSEKGRICERFRLTPILGSHEDWRRFVRDRWHQKLSYEIKFDTGMNRLGLPFESASDVMRQLQKFPTSSLPDQILTHLAMAEDVQSALTRGQLQKTKALYAATKNLNENMGFHFANSAAIWNGKKIGLNQMSDCVRPGLSLFGIRPWETAAPGGLQPVLQFSARIMRIDDLSKGERLGYGGKFTAGPRGARIAILGAGYADGIHRLLSWGRGKVWANGKVLPFLGTISMDLSAVSCPPEARVGDWVEIYGPHLDLWAQAKAAETIPYELLTSVTISNLTRDRLHDEDS